MGLTVKASTRLGAVAVAACLSLATGAHGDLIVPAGGTMALADGAMDLGCTDMTVGGNLDVGSATITTVHDVTIQAGTPPAGTLDGGSGSITLAGDWSNSGTFIPGTSSVFFVDDPGCATGSTLAGDTTFHNLSLVTNVGKTYTFTHGTTQTILAALTIQGTLADPLQIVSDVPGDPGFIDLAAGGTQTIAHVGVTDNWATGQPLAPLLTNEGGTGGTLGWFGIPRVPIPTLAAWSLGLLALVLAGLGIFFGRGRARISRTEMTP